MLNTNLKKIQLSLVNSERLFLWMIFEKFRVNFFGNSQVQEHTEDYKIWKKKKLSG